MLDFTDVMVSDIMHLTCVSSEVKQSRFQVTLFKPFFCGNTMGNVDQDTCFLHFFVGSMIMKGKKGSLFKMCDLGNP